MYPSAATNWRKPRSPNCTVKPRVTRWPAPPARPAARAPTGPGHPAPAHPATVRRLLAALGARTSA